MEEKVIFEEFNSSQMDSRWGRWKWIIDLERKYDLEHNRSVPIPSMLLYWDSRKSYVYKTFFASTLSISSAIESFLRRKIPDNRFKKNLFLSNYIDIALEEEMILEPLKDELLNFNKNVRNNIVHPKGIFGFEWLGFEITEHSKFLMSWESPTGEPMEPLAPQKAAELGIDLYLRTVKAVLKI